MTARRTVATVLDGYRLGSDQGAVAFCAITLIEGPDRHGDLKRILVDTGHTGRRPALDTALSGRGLTRDSIDVVVCTHAHWDHVENLDMFGRAEIAMHPVERRYVRRPHRNDFACPEWIDAVIGRYEDRIRPVGEGTAAARLIPWGPATDVAGEPLGRSCAATVIAPTRALISCKRPYLQSEISRLVTPRSSVTGVRARWGSGDMRAGVAPFSPVARRRRACRWRRLWGEGSTRIPSRRSR